MKRIAIYYRTSTDYQDIDMQKEAIQQWLLEYQKKGIRYKESFYQDIGFSGKNSKRPGYQQMLKDACKRKIDMIVVYRLDRMSRSAQDAIHALLALEQVGVEFISVSQPILQLSADNPFRRTLLAAFAEIAEIEQRTIVERVKSGLEAAKNRGVKLGAPIKIKPEHQEKIYILRTEGMNYRQIAEATGYSYGSVYKFLQTRLGESTSLDKAVSSTVKEL